jgi:hypothetical protein
MPGVSTIPTALAALTILAAAPLGAQAAAKATAKATAPAATKDTTHVVPPHTWTGTFDDVATKPGTARTVCTDGYVLTTTGPDACKDHIAIDEASTRGLAAGLPTGDTRVTGRGLAAATPPAGATPAGTAPGATPVAATTSDTLTNSSKAPTLSHP